MIEIKLPVKALSVNRVWQGRRFKTKAYQDYEKEIFYQLPKTKQIKGEVEIYYKFYIKNYGLSDVDNFLKPIGDILVKAGIIEDDRKIVKLTAEKKRSKKDFIQITIKKVGNNQRRDAVILK